jgi:hypothetical protein
MAVATLQAIRDKVRKLTRSPSVNQITDATIDEYVNTFVSYDFPETLRLFTLKKTFTFYTTPYVDVYASNSISSPFISPLNDFKNDKINISPPIYISGREAFFSQSREEFFNQYPQNSSIVKVGTGNGVTTVFTGTLPGIPVQRNNVVFSSINTSNTGLVLADIPFNSSSGNMVIPADPAPLALDPVNTINYVTGVFTITFLTAPGSGEAVNAQVLPFTAARPSAMLYYENKFTFRPIPDGVYKITMDAFVQPTELLSTDSASEPDLQQWWQYIAYGASKKVLEDRMDLETVQMIMPEFTRQEKMVLRRTVVQITNERTATIYTETTSAGSGANYGGNNG